MALEAGLRVAPEGPETKDGQVWTKQGLNREGGDGGDPQTANGEYRPGAVRLDKPQMLCFTVSVAQDLVVFGRERLNHRHEKLKKSN
jgi:hypothetical protein